MSIKPPKKFIAITTETLNDKTALIATSDGQGISNENGIDLDASLQFLFNQVHKRGQGVSITFVTYAFSRDIEVLFASLSRELKDKLFQSFHIKNQLSEIEYELESINDELYLNANADRERLDFETHVNLLSMRELTEVKYKDYQIILAPGKSLTLRKNGRSISFYDVAGFFKGQTLRQTVKRWTQKDIFILDRAEFNKVTLKGETELDRLRVKAHIETHVICDVINRVDIELKKIGINLSRYHGSSSVATHWLSKIDATGSYHSYRYRRQLSPELHKAARQSYYGGRAEQIRLGTIKNVFVYDINSAYAYACCVLPTLLNKPNYRKEWDASLFSVWNVSYDLRGCGLRFGLLPNRDIDGATKYKLKGSGYFWQPEVSYMLTYYPDAVKVNGGFVWNYERAAFTTGIQYLYELRLKLQMEGNPLERIIKLALSAIYGKFAQGVGRGRFYNPFYPGFITSMTRTMLLNATRENPENVICFQTDAIHTNKRLDVPLSNEMGDYKQMFYPKVSYIDSGVYACYDEYGRIVKTKSRGFRSFDFAQALGHMNDKRVYNALAEFFVGYNLFNQHIFTGANYLSHHTVNKETRPTDNDQWSMRLFDACRVDFKDTHLNSQPLATFNGLESALYCKPGYKGTDAGLDTIEAGRI